MREHFGLKNRYNYQELLPCSQLVLREGKKESKHQVLKIIYQLAAPD